MDGNRAEGKSMGDIQSAIRRLLTNPTRAALFALLIALVALIGKGFLEGTVNKVMEPLATKMVDTAHYYWDDYTCRGRAAEEEADRLSLLVGKRPTQAYTLFRQAYVKYQEAWSCGRPDAGLRLAVAHCKGLGTPKDQLKAHGLVNEIEEKYPAKRERMKEVRKECGFF